MLNFILIVFALTLMSCAKNSNVTLVTSIPKLPQSNDELLPWRDGFYAYAESETGKDLRNENIPISFGKLGYSEEKGGVTGVCKIYTYGDGSLAARNVEIDEVFWSKVNDTSKEIVVLHEMGHCSLRREHRIESTGGVAASLMYPQVISPSTYLSRQLAYISELFANSYLMNSSAETLFSHTENPGVSSEYFILHELKATIDMHGHFGCEH